MTFHWLLTGVALIVAAVAWVRARRLARRLERLAESYWELRYEHGQLQARVNRLDPEEAQRSNAPAPDPRAGAVAFVPLSSLKR